jgi:hypothetical protein
LKKSLVHFYREKTDKNAPGSFSIWEAKQAFAEISYGRE